MAARINSAKVVSLLVGAVLLTCFFGWIYSAIMVNIASARPVPELVALAARAPYAEGYESEGRWLVAQAPLNQNHFNRLYTYAANHPDASTMREAEMRQPLADLGWRSTAAQQNLIVWAAQNGELNLLVNRADGLLRREKLQSEVFELLYLFETDAESRRYLVPALLRHPTWRKWFLADERGLATPARISARLATLQALRHNGGQIERPELAPVLNRLTETGRMDVAFQLWKRLSHATKRQSLVNDPDFKQAAALEDARVDGRFPFEWTTASGRGYDVAVGRATGLPEVHIRWDGRGVPMFLRQRLHLKPGNYAVRLAGTDAQPELVSTLEITAVCPESEARFERPRLGTAKELILASEGPILCEFPELQISGRVTDHRRSTDLKLSSINLISG